MRMRIAAVGVVAVVVLILLIGSESVAEAFGSILALGSVVVFAWATVGVVAPRVARLPSRLRAVFLWPASIFMLIIGAALMPEQPQETDPPPASEEAATAPAAVEAVAAEVDDPSPPLEDWQLWQWDRGQFDAMCSASWLGNERDSVQAAMESASVDALRVQPGDPIQERWDAIVAANRIISPANYYSNLFLACRAHQEQFNDPAVAQALAAHESEANTARNMATQLREMVDAVEAADVCLRINRAGQVWNNSESRFEPAPARCPSVADFEDGTAG